MAPDVSVSPYVEESRKVTFVSNTEEEVNSMVVSGREPQSHERSRGSDHFNLNHELYLTLTKCLLSLNQLGF